MAPLEHGAIYDEHHSLYAGGACSERGITGAKRGAGTFRGAGAVGVTRSIRCAGAVGIARAIRCARAVRIAVRSCASPSRKRQLSGSPFIVRSFRGFSASPMSQ